MSDCKSYLKKDKKINNNNSKKKLSNTNETKQKKI